MNKFAHWMKLQHKKQKGVAQDLGISGSTLHEVLHKGQMPSLILAYKIEKYTQGAITVYTWIDEINKKNEAVKSIIAKTQIKKIST